MKIVNIIASLFLGLFVFIKLPLFANSLMIESYGYPLFVRGEVYEVAFDNGISIGDKFLFDYFDVSDDKLQKLRKNINESFKSNNNKQSRDILYNYLHILIEEKNNNVDPEALIYLNNACAGIYKKTKKVYTIGVAIDQQSDASRQILQGVAQAVNDINGGFSFDKNKRKCKSDNDINIKIVLTDNSFSSGTRLQTKILIKHPEVLAVIVYTTSSNANVAITGIHHSDINFKDSKIPLILPTATRDNLVNFQYTPYVYRIVPNNSLIAENIVKSSLEIAGETHVYIIHSSGIYSTDLFKKIHENDKYKKIHENDKYEDNIEEKYEEVKNYILGGIVDDAYDNHLLILLPDSKSNQENNSDLSISQQNIYKLLEQLSSDKYDEYRDNVLIFSADTFHNIIHELRKDEMIDKLPTITTILPWYAKKYSEKIAKNNQTFEKGDKYLWGGGVGWRYAFANDSIVALNQIFNKINDPNEHHWLDRFLPTRFHITTLRTKVKAKLDELSFRNEDLRNNSKIMTGDSISFDDNERSDGAALVLAVKVN